MVVSCRNQSLSRTMILRIKFPIIPLTAKEFVLALGGALGFVSGVYIVDDEDPVLMEAYGAAIDMCKVDSVLEQKHELKHTPPRGFLP